MCSVFHSLSVPLFSIRHPFFCLALFFGDTFFCHTVGTDISNDVSEWECTDKIQQWTRLNVFGLQSMPTNREFSVQNEIALSGILIGLPPLGHKYSFAPSLACDMHRKYYFISNGSSSSRSKYRKMANRAVTDQMTERREKKPNASA